MKKIMQIMTFVLLIPFLAGWKWNDVSNNKEVLDLNPICEYTGSSSYKSEMGYQTISIEVESTGIYARYDGKNEREVLADSAGNNRMKHTFYITTTDNYYEKVLNYENFNMNTYLSSIKTNNACPSSISICEDGKNYKALNSNDNSSTCFVFKNTSSNVKDTGTTPSGCVSNGATCKRYRLSDAQKKSVFIELGVEKSGSKYYAVAYNSEYRDATIIRQSNNFKGSVGKGITFELKDPSLINKAAFPSSLYLTYDTVDYVNYTYYIYRNKQSSNEGNNNLGTTTPDEKNPGNSEEVDPPSNKTEPDIPLGDADPTSFCVDTAPIWQFMGYIFFLIKIVIPLIIIVLGIVDLFKVLTSNDEKAINKATYSVVQRLIMGVAIFFVPTIISFLFTMLKESVPFLESAEACQTCLLRPNGDACETYKAQSAASRGGQSS